jgi:hypothetical protein
VNCHFDRREKSGASKEPGKNNLYNLFVVFVVRISLTAKTTKGTKGRNVQLVLARALRFLPSVEMTNVGRNDDHRLFGFAAGVIHPGAFRGTS